MQNKIEVLIPSTVNDDPELLKKCIESVFRQTHTNISVILLISGPDTPARASLSEWLKRAPKSLRVVHSQEFLTAALARNLLLAHSKQQTVAFIDSDDSWTPNHLESFTRKTHSIDGTIFYHSAYYRGHEELQCIHKYNDHALTELIQFPVLMSSVIIRGLNVTFRNCRGEDFLFVYDCVNSAHHKLYNPTPTVFYSTLRNKKKPFLYKFVRSAKLISLLAPSRVKAIILLLKYMYYRNRRPFN